MVSDDGALTAAVQEALAAMPDVADKIRAGKVQAAGAIVGQVMKATRGQADAARVRELILAECGVEGCFSADPALTKEALSPEVGGGASFFPFQGLRECGRVFRMRPPGDEVPLRRRGGNSGASPLEQGGASDTVPNEARASVRIIRYRRAFYFRRRPATQ